MWGAATSAYQVEGAWQADGKGESIWDRFSHTPGHIIDGSNGDVACDQYHRYLEDVALLAELGLGAYRFSIAWARVIPDAGRTVNRPGLAYYDRLVDALLEKDIAPFPTLFHWDLPQWVQDAGGWADRAVIDWFAEYADTVVRSLGDRVSNWTVFNEPEVFSTHGHEEGVHAPGLRDADLTLRVSHVVNLAHAAGVRAVRAAAPQARVGSAFNMEIVYPVSDDPGDAAAAERYHAWANAWYLDPLVHGRYPAAFVDPAAALERMDIRPGDMEALATSFDFIGLNMYRRAIIADDPGELRFGVRQVAGPGRRNAFGWEI
ncbi:MAG TPA: family 1 glycosylhydrolase, partial [Candidatus Limnocylindrales bacterium]|nr:family 1 glycosylhydrolase [Candidatus Limnocylindrales bacterium]